jgi:Flp pilus assembly protein TadD
MGQQPDPAYEALAEAYRCLQSKQYDEAIVFFQKAIQAAPARASIHKDLAYAYLKTGERETARDEFGQALQLDPADDRTALEYAFLCYETHREVDARHTFDRLRHMADAATRATAEEAFQNIDKPLAAAVERWTEAVRRGDNSFITHRELAKAAEQRDDLPLAAEHYEKAWRMSPGRRFVMIDLGRVWKALGRIEEADAALLAASRGSEARAAESARELLPARYPYVYEFQNALRFDPRNVDLRREFAYLLLRMDRGEEAEEQFSVIITEAPSDLLSAAQLGFLYRARNDMASAKPLLDRVLQGNDEELANRVRAVLGLPQAGPAGAASPKQDGRTKPESRLPERRSGIS